MVKKINETEFNAIDPNEVAVVDFNATWCGPCKMLAPVLEELSEEFAGKASFYAIDVDDSPSLAEKFNIISIPAVAIVKGGQKLDMNVGFVPKDTLAQFVNKNL